MQIKIIEPFSKAWKRTKKALFHQFDIRKWFILGFTAFLAGLTECSGVGGDKPDFNYNFSFDEFFNLPKAASEWLAEHPLLFVLIITGIIFLFILVVLFTWLSSRGKFMFLDNVVLDRAEISKPWYEFSSQGNSLFLWHLVYNIVVFAVFIFFFIFSFMIAYNIHVDPEPLPYLILIILFGILVFISLALITVFIEMLLVDFVVPVMYKNKINVLEAWGIFLRLFGAHFWNFILYGLFIFAVMILVVMGIIAFGFMTCCIGFLLLIIPVIGDVILLPLTYTLRAFSVEFLEQFGDEFKIFPDINNSNDETVLDDTSG
ncbi:MAG: hypothetical protein K9J16_12330 [Melioribacteraceae bacterium]|nr:hypothetical protein [Melioribacteraceae bacterium]MCF8354703.1 hypothetical protein [Melioribacteraceae bacterium]MCF8393605.1 hypothetical protein [Melioribacteraceae bacterium]MCF8419415.1 hypothetical protein [Melioribacteraceae bacterium]